LREKEVKYGKIVPVHAMKATGGIEVQLHSFITKALDGDDGSTSRPDTFTLRKEHRDSLYVKLGGPLCRAGRFGETKNWFILPEFETRTVQPAG
jgi:hypothetical protein